MSDVVVVKPVESRRDRRCFVDLPWSLYRDDPNWVPPLLHNQRELLGFTSVGRRHPFHESAELRSFLAWRDGEVCGRIAAIENRAHNEAYGERRGFFGFFESVNDPQVATALFDAARTWLAERGIQALRGPANPSMNYECGLLIEGFDSPPTFMMTYNPAYYVDLIEGYGFHKSHDLLAYIGHRCQLPEIEKRIAPLAEQAQSRCQANVRPLNPRRFMADVETFLSLYNSSLSAMWGFVPLGHAEMQRLAGSLRHLIIPELAFIAEADGRAVGAILGLPDYNPVIKRIDGRLFPFGFMQLRNGRHDVRRIRVLSINVVPEYQRWGLGLVLMRSLAPKALAIGVEDAEFSWVSEANDLARLGLEKAGAKHYKTYRMYDYDAPESG